MVMGELRSQHSASWHNQLVEVVDGEDWDDHPGSREKSLEFRQEQSRQTTHAASDLNIILRWYGIRWISRR